MNDVVRAWRPAVPGVHEALHATFRDHAYPAHTHDAWTVLLVERGAVRYDLERSAHVTSPEVLTLLPPGVAHDGRSVEPGRPYRKRVLYLDAAWLPAAAVGAAVHRPSIEGADAAAIARAVHAASSIPGEELLAESGVLALREHISRFFGDGSSVTVRDDPLARRLRSLLDERLDASFTLREAGALLGAHPSHLVRSFSRAYGIAPHRYVTGRRVDLARRLLLAGATPAAAAAQAGFHDQAHLGRHFRRVLGVTPSTFTRHRAAGEAA
ncbi:helix-turn-helix domain-containing protein [Microbacterium sp. P05]|uniref:AraC family transcriptional regulator n=1 Tax=Microbacterium sp. P05 TaxID=3366948 RepID=UPI00374583E0